MIFLKKLVPVFWQPSDHQDCPLRSVGIILRENVQAKAIVLSQNFLSGVIYQAPVELLLGPLYTRSRGWCSTQIMHSYCAKVEISPQG